MHKITINKEKNRITITLVGFISEQEALMVKKNIITEAPNLKENFDVITDITHFKLGLEDSSEVLKEIIKYLSAHKVNRVVRVVGSSQAGMLQFAEYTRAFTGYNVHYVPSLEDAEKLLDAAVEEKVTIR